MDVADNSAVEAAVAEMAVTLVDHQVASAVRLDMLALDYVGDVAVDPLDCPVGLTAMELVVAGPLDLVLVVEA